MASAFSTPAPKQAWPESTPLTAAKRAEHSEGYAYCVGSTKHGECGLPHQGKPIRAPRLQTRLMKEGVVQASCGWRHTAFLLSSGEAYACGDGAYGKLGSGDTALLPEPSRVHFPTPVHVMSVSCGQHHTAFVGADRTVWTCGLGLYGQLGHGDSLNEFTPRCVEAARGKVVAAACGDLHTLLLYEDGRALSCGLGEGGRLGLPVPQGEAAVGCVTSPCEVPLNAALKQVEAYRVAGVSCGGAHSGLIYSEGSAYTFGRGEQGQLGHGATVSEPTPRKVTELQGVRLKRLSCGAQHSLFLSAQGGVWACGSGGSGRLGLGLGLGGREGSLLPRQVPGLSGTVIVQVSAGAWHSAFVSDAGGVLLCGADESGQLGLGGPAMTATKVSAPPKLWQQPGAVVLGTSCGGEVRFMPACVSNHRPARGQASPRGVGQPEYCTLACVLCPACVSNHRPARGPASLRTVRRDSRCDSRCDSRVPGPHLAQHTVFVLKALVDPEDDVRAAETEAAAKLVQRLVRGGATRKSIASSPHRSKLRLPGTYTELQRVAAATELQAMARSRAVRRQLAAEVRRGTSLWSGLRSRFVAALASAPFEEAGKAGGGRQTKSKSDW